MHQITPDAPTQATQALSPRTLTRRPSSLTSWRTGLNLELESVQLWLKNSQRIRHDWRFRIPRLSTGMAGVRGTRTPTLTQMLHTTVRTRQRYHCMTYATTNLLMNPRIIST